MPKKALSAVLAALLVIAAGIQFVQPERSNPISDPAASFEVAGKPAARIAAIVERACRDCHSHRTVWPWYGRVAPVSWLVADDVREGRAHLNLSEWGRLSPEMARLRLGEMCREMQKGDMPLWQYRLLHPEARLSPEDVAAFCAAAQ